MRCFKNTIYNVISLGLGGKGVRKKMCWDYSECGKCGERTQCIASCYCSTDEECESNGHRDCKSFASCETCYQDICDECLEKERCDQCYKTYCEDCADNPKEHTCLSPT